MGNSTAHHLGMQGGAIITTPSSTGTSIHTEGCGSTLNSWAFLFKALKSVGGEIETFNRPLDPAGVRAAGQGLLPGSLLHLTELSVFTGQKRQPLSYLTTSQGKKFRAALEKQVTWKPMRNKVKCFQNNHTPNSISITSHFTKLGNSTPERMRGK